MEILLLIILVILVGSKAVYKNDFAVINGTKIINASTAENISINYPTGFTAENCVPVCCGLKYSNRGYNYVGKYDDSMDLYWGAIKRTLTFGTDNITLRIDNVVTEQTTYNYKIVLMKI